MPVLVLLVFGIIEYGLAFKDSLTVSSATRAGARTASAEPRSQCTLTPCATLPQYAYDAALAVARSLSALPSTAPQELWIYKADANGNPDSGSFSTQCTQCIILSWNASAKAWNTGSPGTGSPVKNNWPGTGTGSQNDCSASVDSVGVWVKATHKMISGIFGSTTTLTDHTVMRLEPIPSGQSCSG